MWCIQVHAGKIYTSHREIQTSGMQSRHHSQLKYNTSFPTSSTQKSLSVKKKTHPTGHNSCPSFLTRAIFKVVYLKADIVPWEMPETPNNPTASANPSTYTVRSWDSWEDFAFLTRSREQNLMMSFIINYKVCLVSDTHLTHIRQFVSCFARAKITIILQSRMSNFSIEGYMQGNEFKPKSVTMQIRGQPGLRDTFYER